MHRHIELTTDTKDTLTRLTPESIEWKGAQTDHFLFGTLLQWISDGIVYLANNTDAGGMEFKVLCSRGGRQDNGSRNDDGGTNANMLGTGQLFEGQGGVVGLVLGGSCCCCCATLLKRALLAETIQRTDHGAIVHVDKDNGSSATHADATDPAVERGVFVRDELWVVLVETRELDKRLRGQSVGVGGDDDVIVVAEVGCHCGGCCWEGFEGGLRHCYSRDAADAVALTVAIYLMLRMRMLQ